MESLMAQTSLTDEAAAYRLKKVYTAARKLYDEYLKRHRNHNKQYRINKSRKSWK